MWRKVIKEQIRTTKGYGCCGLSATEKNLIRSGWQVGIWFVELISAVIYSFFTFLTQSSCSEKFLIWFGVHFCCDGDGRV